MLNKLREKRVNKKAIDWLQNIIHDEEERNTHEDDLKYSKEIHDLILYLLEIIQLAEQEEKVITDKMIEDIRLAFPYINETTSLNKWKEDFKNNLKQLGYKLQ